MPRVSAEMTQAEFVECCQEACANLATHCAHMPDDQFEEALVNFIGEVLAALARTFGEAATPDLIAGVKAEVQTGVWDRRRRMTEPSSA